MAALELLQQQAVQQEASLLPELAALLDKQLAVQQTQQQQRDKSDSDAEDRRAPAAPAVLAA